MMEGEIEAKTAQQLLEEANKKIEAEGGENLPVMRSNKEIIEGYLNTLPFPLKKQEIIDAEIEWVEIQIEKQKLLEMAKKALLEKGDYQFIGKKAFIIKSGLRRLMSAFGISITKVITTDWQRPWPTAPPDYIKSIGAAIEYGYHSQAWAEKKTTISKNGQTATMVTQEMVGTGGFSTREQYEKHQPYKDHNVYAMSETRAKSRAASDILSGNVTFEEL